MKKGFTLIELLAVIIILGIIGLIATPIVLNVIDNSKKAADKISEENYIRAVKIALASYPYDIDDGSYSVMSNGNICIGTYTTTCSKELEIKINGDMPNIKSIYISNGEPLICKFVSRTGYTTSQSVGAQYSCALDTERTFYVLEDNGSTIDLIMDRNYTDTTVTTMTWCVSGSNTSCNHDGLDPYIEHIQNVFGDSVTVGIPSYNQIYSINNSRTLTSSPWIYGNISSNNNNEKYWTSTPDSNNDTGVWGVTSSGNLNNRHPCNSSYSLRPVITISKAYLN